MAQTRNCPYGFMWNPQTGKCEQVMSLEKCPPGYKMVNGRCVEDNPGEYFTPADPSKLYTPSNPAEKYMYKPPQYTPKISTNNNASTNTNKPKSTNNQVVKPKSTNNQAARPKLNISAADLYNYAEKVAMQRPENIFKQINSKYGSFTAFKNRFSKYYSDYDLTPEQKKELDKLLKRTEIYYNVGKRRLGEQISNINNKNTAQTQKSNSYEPNVYIDNYNVKGNDDFSQLYSSVMANVKPQLESFKREMTNLWKELGNTRSLFDIYDKKIQLTNKAFQDRLSGWTNTFNNIKTTISKIKENYGNIYDDIAKRIENYENLLNNKFKELSNNLEEIGNKYKKVLDYNVAAAGSAAEKQLRGLTGRAAQLRAANMLREQAMQADKQLAELEAQLANQKNTLVSDLLKLKKMVIDDKNINDKEKQQILANLDQQLINLDKEYQGIVDKAKGQIQGIAEEYLNEKLQQAKNVEQDAWIQLALAWGDVKKRDELLYVLKETYNIPDNIIEEVKKYDNLKSALAVLKPYINK